MKIIGVVPARMAASRFPGKPLMMIKGMPMVEHVFRRAAMYPNWDDLVLATCDDELHRFAKERNIPSIDTGTHHVRALDRVAEAVAELSYAVSDNDIVVCVQGDEPMLRPDMVDTVIAPILKNSKIECTVLAMHITDENVWLNKDTVKIVHNEHGEVLYTSRAPVPYCKEKFSTDQNARRIYGIFAFRWRRLKEFTNFPETRLEKLEACDSNRILDMEFRQYIAPYPSIKSYSVDSPEDLKKVEEEIESDGLYGKY